VGIVGIYTVNHSQTHECGNWDLDPDIPFLGIFVSKFWYFVFAVGDRYERVKETVNKKPRGLKADTLPEFVSRQAFVGHVVEGVDEDCLHVARAEGPHQHRVHIPGELSLVVPARATFNILDFSLC
jgi:hypothetical protein